MAPVVYDLDADEDDGNERGHFTFDVHRGFVVRGEAMITTATTARRTCAPAQVQAREQDQLGSMENPFELESDDDDTRTREDEQDEDEDEDSAATEPRPASDIIDLTSGEDAEPDVEERIAATVVRGRSVELATDAVDLVRMDSYNLSPSAVVRVGTTVKLVGGDYMLVKCLGFHEVKRCVVVRGIPVLRSSRVPFIANHKREVVYVFRYSSRRSAMSQSLVERDFQDILGIRRVLRTNAVYPLHTGRQMTARWKLIEEYEGALDEGASASTTGRTQPRILRKAIEALTPAECTPGYAIAEEVKRFHFRGTTYLGGSSLVRAVQHGEDRHWQCSSCQRRYRDRAAYARHQRCEKRGQPLPGEASVVQTSVDQQYTFGDMFGGAGGMSCGALAAGLVPVLMVDLWEDAIRTYRHNHPLARVLHEDVTNFVHRAEYDDEFTVDCLHLSPPCQEFSPANCSAQKGTGRNFDALFSVGHLLKKLRPRVATLEQTFGIMHPRWRDAMAELIRMFTDLGCSISWQLVHLQEYGVPSIRKRFIIIASCPGEPLPSLPTPTHTTDPRVFPRRQPLTTARAVLETVERAARRHRLPNHDPQERRRGYYAPWHPDVQVQTICHGGLSSHWTGSRHLTERELAALQTYPVDYAFHGRITSVKTQIGNSVPPRFAEVLWRHLRAELQKRDGLERAAGHES